MYKPFYIVTQMGHEIARFKDEPSAKNHAKKFNNTNIIYVVKDRVEPKKVVFRKRKKKG